MKSRCSSAPSNNCGGDTAISLVYCFGHPKKVKFIKQVKPWKRDPIRHGSDAIMRVGLT